MASDFTDDTVSNDKFERIGESVDPVTGEKTVYVRSRVKSAGVYAIPDYATSPGTFRAHKSGTNVLGVISTVLMFLTMMGTVTAAWVTMSERQAKTETFQKLKFEAYKEVLGSLRDDVIANRNDIARNRRDMDRRLRTLIESNNSINVQLVRIQSLLEGSKVNRSKR